MLGRDNYKIQGFSELKANEWRSLYLLYQPLVNNEALMIYSYFVNAVSHEGIISDLLISLNMTLDSFIVGLEKLNQFRLLDTYHHNLKDQYLFILKEPKDTDHFLNDDIFSRILLNTIGKDRYSQLYASLISSKENLNFYKNETKNLVYNNLNNWTSENEEEFKRIKKQEIPSQEYQSYFDIKRFLKEASNVLLPLKFRTKDNINLICRYADIYNISQERMRVIIGNVVSSNLNEFNTHLFKLKCANARPEIKSIAKGDYNVPCALFLTHLQNGQAPAPSDMQLVSELVEKYHLNIEVVNVLLEYALKRCDNRLIKTFIFPTAADLHRNHIANKKDAMDFLYNSKVKLKNTHPQDILPVYDDSNNPEISDEEYEKLLHYFKEGGK